MRRSKKLSARPLLKKIKRTSHRASPATSTPRSEKRLLGKASRRAGASRHSATPHSGPASRGRKSQKHTPSIGLKRSSKRIAGKTGRKAITKLKAKTRENPRSPERRTARGNLSKMVKSASAKGPGSTSIASRKKTKSTGHHQSPIRHSLRRTGPKNVSTPRTAAQYLGKTERFKNTYDRVLTAISKMRDKKLSLRQASKIAGVSPRTVARYAGRALQKRENGKYAATTQDNLLRALTIPTSQGPQEILVRGSRQATLLGEYWNAVHRYLQTGDDSRLRQFTGKHIKDASGLEIPLLTDPAILDTLGAAGVLSFESLYARTA